MTLAFFLFHWRDSGLDVTLAGWLTLLCALLIVGLALSSRNDD